MRFTRTPSSLLTIFISLTFTSVSTWLQMASRRLRWVSSVTGTIRVLRGWRTLMLTLWRSASTIDVMVCASLVRSSISRATVSRHWYRVWYAASLSSVMPPPQKRLRFRRTYQLDRSSPTNSPMARAARVGS